MTGAALLTLAVLAGVLYLLVSDRLPPAVAMMGGVIVLLVFGVLSPEQALSGFSNPAPFAVAALYIVARAVEKTGALQPILRAGLQGVTGPRAALARLLIPVTLMSAFFNNTPVVAMVAPQVEAWARRTGRSSSRFLMPLSFAAILGGTLTVIGTSTTLVVSGLMEAHGMAPLSLFEITRWSLPLVALGLVYLILVAPALLPDRATAFSALEGAGRDFMVVMEVEPGGAIDGQTVALAGLRDLAGVFLTEVQRGSEIIAPAGPDTVLHRGDLLLFVGRPEDVLDLRSRRGLRSAEHDHAVDFHDAGHTYFEAVIGAGSRLVGKTLKTAGFRGRYQAAVLGIHRAGAPVRAKLGEVRLRAGDTLLLLTDEGFRDRWRDRSDFLLIARMGGLAPATLEQVGRMAMILGGVLVLAVAGVLSILQAALGAAFLLVTARVLTPGEARRAVDLDVVLLIAASFGLGSALEVTGVAAGAATGLLAMADPFGTLGAVAAIVIATLLLTELVTNNAAAVLIYPLALAVGGAAGIDPLTSSMLVAVAASCSFLTPIGYQTNTMVWGPGGYRFTDYIRLGLPLTLVVVGWLLIASRLYI